MASAAVKTARQEVREAICPVPASGCFRWIHGCSHTKKGSFQQSLGSSLTGAVGGVAGAYTAGLGTDVASGLTSSLLSSTPLGGADEQLGAKGSCAAVAAYISGSGPLPDGEWNPKTKAIVARSKVFAVKAAKVGAALAATILIAAVVLRARG